MSKTTARGNKKNSNSHKFEQIPQALLSKSTFDRSFSRKLTCNSGLLIPLAWDEVYPGDYIDLKRQIVLARLTTPIVPFMDQIYMSLAWFFVPYRVLWPHWEKLQGAQDNPGDSISFSTPYIMTPNDGVGAVTQSLADYLEVPTNVANLKVSAMPFRAYTKILNDWYRAQELQNSYYCPTDDGPDTYASYALKNRAKKADFFTTCTLAPQRGAGVTLPLGTTAPVILTPATGALNPSKLRKSSDRTLFTNNTYMLSGADANGYFTQSAGNVPTTLDPNGSLVADLTNATAATINSLRLSFAVQRMLERDARGGTRYAEALMARWGVKDPQHAVLQRSQFLAGTENAIYSMPIPQTDHTPASGTPQGNLAAHAQGVGNVSFKKSFTEHGIIMCLMDFRADISYQQGLPRKLDRWTRYDFYEPAMACLGERPVLNKELYCKNNANDALVFGYQEAWSELRYGISSISGCLRHNVTAGFATLDWWHLGESFASLPTLSDTFIQSSSKSVIDRVISVTTQPQWVVDAYFNAYWTREMPVYSVPGMIDHY